MNDETKLARPARRGFLAQSAALAGGLALGFHVPERGAQAQAQAAAPEINAWVVVRPDDSVVIRIARSEMGQGTATGLAQLVAEELECDWSKVSIEFPTPGQNVARQRVWRDFATGGSRGIRDSHQYVRAGGAAARMMLVEAAAAQWGVPAAECTVSAGTIRHAASNRSTSYGKVAAAAGKLAPPAEPRLKDPKDWKIAGKPIKRLDTAHKVDGSLKYAIDLQMPGMLNAAIRDCPVFGGKVKSFDAAKVAGMPGVKKVVQVGESAVAVVATTWWQAKTALGALPVTWDEGANAAVSSASIDALLTRALDATDANVGNRQGDIVAAAAGAAKKVTATYSYPYQHHATLEPMTATARWTPERCEVWCPTQNGEAALAATAEASGLPIAQCDVHKQFLGGGFGRRGLTDYVRQAVAIAKEMPGTPVKLIWSREEDMLHGFYHPISQCRLTGTFDAANNLTGFQMRLAGQSILATVAPSRMTNGVDPVVFQGLNPAGAEGKFGYNVPNILIDHVMRNPHVPAGFWRGVNNNQNAIYVECFMDELAHAVGQDALEFRRKLLKDSPRHLAVLEAVAERAGWGKPAPAGVFRGLAQQMGFGSYVAACAEVSVSADGKLKVHRIVAATDCGHAVNPAQIERQVAGSFVYGLSAALYGNCTVKDGRMEKENFDTYRVLRMDEMPKVETIILQSGGVWGGVGEPTIFVAAPAVLNAIFAATGRRIRKLPLAGQDLRAA